MKKLILFLIISVFMAANVSALVTSPPSPWIKLPNAASLDTGITYSTETSFTDADTDPSILNSVNFVTANTGATTIDDFDDGIAGQVILIRVGDGDTTFDFTASSLKGNGGSDYAATQNDTLEFYTPDGTTWYCTFIGKTAGGAGTGSVTTIEHGNVQVGGATMVVIDFGDNSFDVTESPPNEANISLDVVPSSGSATIMKTGGAIEVKYDSTDFGEGANGLYLGASPTVTTSFSIGADPAEAGALRLSNNTNLAWENSTPGTDIVAFGVDASQIVQIGASGASGTTITPNLTLSGTLTDGTATLTSGAWTGITTLAMSHTAPDITLSDSDDAAGTGNLAFVSANARDIVATLQADIAGTATTFITLDGTNEKITFSKYLDTFDIGHASDTTLSRVSAGDLQIEANIIYRAGGTDVAIADGGTGAGSASTAASALGVGTEDSPQFTGIELSHASANTLTASGGVLSIESAVIHMVGGTDIADGDVANNITIDLSTLASTVTVVDGTDATSFVGIFDSATGSLAVKTDGALLYDASAGALQATSFTDGTSVISGGTIELGAASDTTLARSAAGAITVEGDTVILSSDTITGDVGVTFDTDGSSAATIADSVAVTSWNLTTPTVTNGAIFTPEDASPNADGELVMDMTVAGLDDGALAYYEGGDTVYYLVATAEIPDDADDDKHLAYDKDTDRWYMRADATAGAPTLDSVGDPDAEWTPVHADDEKITISMAQDTAGSFFSIDDTDTAIGNAVWIMELQHSADSDADANFFKCVDNNTDVWFQIQEEGKTSIGADPGDSGVFNLDNAAVISWEDTTELTLTHVDNTGLLINSTHQLQFGDSGTFINQSTDGTFNIAGDTLIEITGPNLRLEVDDAAYLNIATAQAGITTISQVSDGTDGITIGDGDDAIIIGAGGNVSITSAGLDLSTAGALSNVTTIGMGGALSGATTIGLSHTAPTVTFEDSNDAAGTGHLIFASAETQDVIGYIQVDVGGNAASYIEIDGVSETVDVLKPLVASGDITSGDSFIIGSADIEEAELEILDGSNVTTAELEQLATLAATTISANQWAALGSFAETLTGAEVNILDGVTGVTAAELSYIGDVTGAIQAQIDGLGGDVTAVGTCASGDCLDGTSDGGTTISLYDGDTNKLTIDAADLSGDATLVLGSDTNNITVVNGTAAIDIAAGATLNIDVGLTVGTNAGTLNYTAASKTLSVEDTAVVSQDYSSDASPTFVTVTHSTSVVTPLIDAAGDEDMDYGSGDVDDHTFIADGGTVVIDGSYTSTVDANATAMTLNADYPDTGAQVGLLITTDDDDNANYDPFEIRDDSGTNNDLLFFIDHSGTVQTGIWDAGAVTSSGAITAAAGVDLGTSQALVGTTAMTIGGGTQTVAVDSSDWDIDATGAISNAAIDADSNTISNIDDGEIKASAGIQAEKLEDGTVTGAEFLYINTLSSNVQTQIAEILDGTTAFSGGIDLGTSQAVVGTTALTIGDNTQTVAINSSDWDIDATGIMTGIGNITSGGVVTSAGFTIGSAAILEAELEIIDGATLTTTQLEYLNAATGTTGTTNTNLVFSASPTLTGTAVAAGIDGSGTFSANLFTPDAADGADIGTTSLEFSDIYLANGSIIYAQNDQSNTMTSSANGWDFALSLGIADDKFVTFGGNLSARDWTAGYDETTSNRLEFTHTAGNDSDVYWDLNDANGDATFTIENSDATYKANVAVSGDFTADTFTQNAKDDCKWWYRPATAGESSWWSGINHDSVGDDNDNYEIRQNATPGSSVELYIQPDGDTFITGDLTITGDDLFMTTNTAGLILIGDNTNYNPTAVSGDGALASNGALTISDLTIASESRGDVLTFNPGGSGGWKSLAVGTAGYYLTTDGTDISWASVTASMPDAGGVDGVIYEVTGTATSEAAFYYTQAENLLTVAEIGVATEEIVIFTDVASAINELTIENAASGGNPKIDATGGGTNIGIEIDAKAAGEIIIGSADAKFSLVSDALDISNAGAISNATTIGVSDAISLSDAATLDQSANNLVEITENGDYIRFSFDATDVNVLWSDGALNLENLEDGIDAIVNIKGKDASEKGILRVLSDGDDKYIELYNDDTDAVLTNSAGNIIINPVGLGVVIGDNGDEDYVLTFDADSADGTITWDEANSTFVVNLEWEVDGTLDADGVVALGDGGDNFSIASDGIDVTTAGAVSNVTTLATTDVVSHADTTEASAIGTAALITAGGLGVAFDAWIGDDLVLDSDETALKFGADQEIPLTHVQDTGLQMQLDDSIMFGDTAVFIESDDDGYLDLDADTGVRINSPLLTMTAADNPYIWLNDDDDMDVYFINDDVGAELEISTDSTVGQNNMAVLSEVGAFTTTSNMTIGVGADVNHTLTFDNDDTDGVITRWADEKTFAFSNIIAVVPQTYQYTTDVETFVPGTEATSSIILLDGDDDGTDEEIDIGDAPIAGTIVTFIAVADIDSTDDEAQLDFEEDSTCTNCPNSGVIILDKIGESVTAIWTGATWSMVSVSNSL